MTETPETAPKRNWIIRHKILSILGAIVLIIIVVSVASSSSKKPAKTDASTQQPSPTTSAAVAANESEIASAKPTAAPTKSASPTPTPTKAAPKPVTYSGTGDSVVAIAKPATGPVLVTVTHPANQANFAIEALDENMAEKDLLVNVIGGYNGTVLLDSPAALTSGETKNLKVSATGPWTITLADVSTAPAFDKTFTGKGDMVVRYTGKAGVVAITNTGQGGNFAVESLGGDIPDLLVNEIGNYSGTVPISARALLAVHSDGNWSLTLK